MGGLGYGGGHGNGLVYRYVRHPNGDVSAQQAASGALTGGPFLETRPNDEQSTQSHPKGRRTGSQAIEGKPGNRLHRTRRPGPEFHDFDLLATAPVDSAARQDGPASIEPPASPLRERALWSLDYVVFDLETTGLRPSDGDQIVQIGAVHVSAGELALDRMFDQLVNPARKIPKRTIRIHGITNERVANAPPVSSAVAAFHDFAGDAILVAHNAAFDLKFPLALPGRGGREIHPASPGHHVPCARA